MIVLKHLAQEFRIDPRELRAILRSHDYSPSQGRWKWEENSPQLREIRLMLGKSLSRSRGKPIPITIPPKPKRSRRTT